MDNGLVLEYDLVNKAVISKRFTGHNEQYWRRVDPLKTPHIIDLPKSPRTIQVVPEYQGCLYRPVDRKYYCVL